MNGSPTKEFSMSKGICQGDSLSLLIFFLVVEGMNVVMKEDKYKGLFCGVATLANGVGLSII